MLQITALEQLRNEMQEELLQQSVENSKLQHANEALAKQLSKTDDKSTSLQATVASLTEDNLKVCTPVTAINVEHDEQQMSSDIRVCWQCSTCAHCVCRMCGSGLHS